MSGQQVSWAGSNRNEPPGNTNAAALAGARGAGERVASESNLDRDHAAAGRLLATLYWCDRSNSVQPLAELRRAWA